MVIRRRNEKYTLVTVLNEIRNRLGGVYKESFYDLNPTATLWMLELRLLVYTTLGYFTFSRIHRKHHESAVIPITTEIR